MAGVLRHSDFRADPWGRLMRTADYVGTVTFGSHDEVDTAGARVRGIHEKVRGADPVTGVRYSARDPALLTWVHCCEVESFLTTYQRAGGGLTGDEGDAYYAEQTRAAAVVGLDPRSARGDAAAMAASFGSMRPQRRVARRTRGVPGYVLAPPMPGRVQWLTPARPAWATAAG